MNEKSISPASGIVALLLLLAVIAGSVVLIAGRLILPGGILLVFSLFMMIGLTIVNPNSSVVCVLFGEYMGTIRANGFFWVNPFYSKKKLSLRARNMESQSIKVNDKLGNPILIGIVLVWKVEETFKAAFEVDHYEAFVKIQSESAVRKLAGLYVIKVWGR
jgi:regulator of protease activity HflC (stomatin/prohibitin superfamily)